MVYKHRFTRWPCIRVATVELVGGILLIIGLGVRYVGLLFALILAGAIVKVNGAAGLLGDGKNPGYELDLALLSMGAYLFVVKAEGYVDRFLKESNENEVNFIYKLLT